MARHGEARQAWRGEDWLGLAWRGTAKQGRHGFLTTEESMSFETERDYLLELAELNDGLLTADTVLEDARQETSPLHKHFQWNDSLAAEQYRRWQARSLIAKCRITIEPRTESTIRAFVSLPSDRGQEGGYRVMTAVLSEDDQRDELLADMRNRVTYWTRQASLLDPQTRQALNRFAEQIALPAQVAA